VRVFCTTSAVLLLRIRRDALLQPDEDADGLDDSVTWRRAQSRADEVELVSRRDPFECSDYLRRSVWQWVHDRAGRDDDQVWRQVVTWATGRVHGELIRTVHSVHHDVVAGVDGRPHDR
jgi:hypothetical protein